VDDSRQCTSAETRQTSLPCGENLHHEADIDVTGTSSRKQRVSATISNDNREKACEYAASLKIDSSFVADSLALDGAHSEMSNENQSSPEKQLRMETEIADVDCSMQHKTEQPIYDSGSVAEEPASRPDSETVVASHYSHAVSVLCS